MDPPSLPQRGLWNFGAYVKARELFELVISDLSDLSRHPACGRLVAQQIASADSIASNIEEGYGRRSPRDFAHFLVIARGSPRRPLGATSDSNIGCLLKSSLTAPPYVGTSSASSPQPSVRYAKMRSQGESESGRIHSPPLAFTHFHDTFIITLTLNFIL